MAILYLVSTPIGNLGDVTIRALETLWSVDLILCEDTRETQVLLNHYKDKFDSSYPRLLSYNDHNHLQRIPRIISILSEGENVALVTDRGTPLLSDPGYKLVEKVLTLEGCKVDSIPGANAILPALQLSGFPPDSFYFSGFLPKKDNKCLATISEFPPTTILFYESPLRLKDSLQRIYETLGDKSVAVCIELTKKFQTVYRGRISEVLEQMGNNPVKGEVTVVLDNR